MRKKKKVKSRNEVAYSLAIRKGGSGAHTDKRKKRATTRLSTKLRAIKEQED